MRTYAFRCLVQDKKIESINFVKLQHEQPASGNYRQPGWLRQYMDAVSEKSCTQMYGERGKDRQTK